MASAPRSLRRVGTPNKGVFSAVAASNFSAWGVLKLTTA